MHYTRHGNSPAVMFNIGSLECSSGYRSYWCFEYTCGPSFHPRDWYYTTYNSATPAYIKLIYCFPTCSPIGYGHIICCHATFDAGTLSFCPCLFTNQNLTSSPTHTQSVHTAKSPWHRGRDLRSSMFPEVDYAPSSLLEGHLPLSPSKMISLRDIKS